MERRNGLREIWNKACANGMVHTAYGMLLDKFHLWDLLEHDSRLPATAAQIVGVKRDLMLMIGDGDGDQFQGWRQLWKNDRKAFEKSAVSRIRDCLEE